jgi:subfamily B ATP-binding cassette protein MsbA
VSRLADGRRFVRLLRRYVAPMWPAMALLVVASYLATVMAALSPVVMAPILDLALGRPVPSATATVGPVTGLSLNNLGVAVQVWLSLTDGDRLRTILILCAAFAALGILKGVVDFGNYLLALWIRVRAATAMQRDLFAHLLSLSLRFFARQRPGELVSRLDTDARAATGGLETLVGSLLTAPVLALFYGYLLVRTSPRLVVAAGAAAALHYGITRAIRGPIRRLAGVQFSAFAELAARFQETLQAIRIVKSFGAEAYELARASRMMQTVRRAQVWFGVFRHGEEPARAALNAVIEAGLLGLAAWELLAGRMAAPTFLLFLYVGRAATTQVAAVAGAVTGIQLALGASERLGQLFAERPELADGAETIDELRDRIVLEHVSFDYGGERVLDGVSFEIRKGEMVALVGPSGVGKSTLADLLLRLYDPLAGRITVDGRDLRALRQGAYRHLFGVVPQDAMLFNASIRDNITYAREGVGDEDVVRAARIANAHDFIVGFPEGYETIVGDRGVRLSGGQRQRIAIARAIVTRPPILVFDEATSSLDSESERLVQQAINRVLEDGTSIVIAHRLSTVLHADKIVVLSRSRVEAIGRHAELLASSPTYAELYRQQFAEAESLVGSDPASAGPGA